MRRFLRWALFQTWRLSLSRGDRMRLDYWGATGNPKHGPHAWAYDDYSNRDGRCE